MRLGRLCRAFWGGAALAAALGCLSCSGPSDKYEIVMEPEDNSLDRQLTAWMEGGSHKAGEPSERRVSAEILKGFAAKYPHHITTDPNAARQTFAGKFAGKLPGEFGGAGEYRIIHTLMGSAAVYVERFAGTDDLTWQLEQINLAADIVADTLGGYFTSQLQDRPGIDKLRKFMDTDFRKDIKNLSIYLWSVKSGLVTSEDNKMEIRARVVLYLVEHDYIHYDRVIEFARQMMDSAISADDKVKAGQLVLRRFLARKMEIDEASDSFAFLNDPNEVAKSFEQFVSTSDVCRRNVELWNRRSASWPVGLEGSRAAESQPVSATSQLASAPAKPDPGEVFSKVFSHATGALVNNLVDIETLKAFYPLLTLFSRHHRPVSVTLKLPAKPLMSNGNWNERPRGLTWSFDHDGKPLSHICYAVWASPDKGFQSKRFGRSVLDGQELALYCLWQKGLTADESRQWDEFLRKVSFWSAEKQLSKYCDEHPKPETAEPSMFFTGSYITLGAQIIIGSMHPHASTKGSIGVNADRACFGPSPPE